MGDILQSSVKIISQLTFFSSFFARTTLRMILPGGTRSSSAMISTDLTEGARLGSLEAGFDDVLDYCEEHKNQTSGFNFRISSPGRWLGGHNRRGLWGVPEYWQYWRQAFFKNSYVPTWIEQQDTARTLESRPTCSLQVWTTSQQSPISGYTNSLSPILSNTWLWRMPIILMEALPRRSSLPTSSSNTFEWKFC